MRPSKQAAQRKHQRSGSAKKNLLLTLSADEAFRDDSALLLSVASQFLCEGDSVDNSAFSFAPIVDFPSFQALLNAATSAVPVNQHPDERLLPTQGMEPLTSIANAPSTRTQKRRERNRISCRKTRLKRKMEHASEEILAHQRADHNTFLSKLHRELIQLDKQQQKHHDAGAETLEREWLACQFIVRSLHFQLVDSEYDATWCYFVDDPIIAPMSRRHHVSNNSASRKVSVVDDPQQVLLVQWRAIVADIENPNLEIVQIRSEQENAKDDSQFQLCCQWRLTGISKDHLQSGRVEKRTVSGVTSVRFSGRSIQSIDMRVAPSATEEYVAV